MIWVELHAVVVLQVSIGARPMKTLKCRKCSAIYPASDKNCPSCNASSRSLPLSWIAGALVAVAAGVYFVSAQDRQPPASAGPRDSEVLTLAFSSVRANMKDPGSAKFGQVKRYSVGDGRNVACGSVNAKNSFGAYAGEKRFVFTYESGIVMIDDGSSVFSTAWSTLCR